MAFFELIAGIGFIGLAISFAASMYLESVDSIENKIANGSAIFFLIIAVAGIVGYLL